MIFLKYLFYILKHKYYVFQECWKKGLYLRAFTHDLSKFLPDEFFPYAHWHYGKYGVNSKHKGFKEFKAKKEKVAKAIEKHYLRNRHHHKHMIAFVDHSLKKYKEKIEIKEVKYGMVEKDALEMICDWKAMSRVFGGSAKDYYLKIKDKLVFVLMDNTIKFIEKELGIESENKGS